MVFNMLTGTQEDILGFLLGNPDEKLTIRGIAKRLGKSYALVYNNIADLEKKKLVVKQNVPPGQIITLNEFAPSWIFVDIELKRKNEFLEKHLWVKVLIEDIFNSVNNVFFILLVFGSYAKGTQTKKSDIDLLFIVKDRKYIRKIENSVKDIYSKAKTGINFADANDFREMIKDTNKMNIGNEAKKHHIILYGAEAYYQLLRK